MRRRARAALCAGEGVAGTSRPLHHDACTPSSDPTHARVCAVQVIAAGYASCTGLAIFLVNACRAVGIPARVAGGWVGVRACLRHNFSPHGRLRHVVRCYARLVGGKPQHPPAYHTCTHLRLILLLPFLSAQQGTPTLPTQPPTRLLHAAGTPSWGPAPAPGPSGSSSSSSGGDSSGGQADVGASFGSVDKPGPKVDGGNHNWCVDGGGGEGRTWQAAPPMTGACTPAPLPFYLR